MLRTFFPPRLASAFRTFVGHVSILLIWFTPACDESPTGLQPVSGVEGEVQLVNDMPAEYKGLVIVVINEIPKDTEQILNGLDTLIVTYSDPILPGESQKPFFIQLNPGGFIMGMVALTVDPGFFAVNIDSLLASPNPPIVPLLDFSDPPFSIINSVQSVAIVKESVRVLDEPWKITF